MKECNCDLRDGDAKTAVFGSNEMLQPAPVDTIPMEPTTPQIAYQMVKDETFAQTQPHALTWPLSLPPTWTTMPPN